MKSWKSFLGRSVASASLVAALCFEVSGCISPDDGAKADPGIIEVTSSALTVNSWTYKGGNGVVMQPGSSPVIFSGIVTDVEYVPASANYRLASAGGGVFQWNGSSWTPISDSLAPTSPSGNSGVAMSATATHPTNSAIILAGTGSLGFGSAGSGLWRTTNTGSTWTNVLPLSTTGSLVYRISWSTHAVGTVWVATSNGLFRSTDSGATWIRLFTGQVTDVAHKPDDSSLVFAFANTGIYRSPDGGGSWAAVFFLPSGTVSTINLAIDSSTGNNVYAQWGNNSGLIAMAKSTNGGLNWSTITAPNQPNDTTCGNDGLFGAVGVSPDGQTVIAGCYYYFSRSTNGGATWTTVSTTGNYGGLHLIKFQNATTVLNGSDTGYHYSLDGGATWASTSNTIPIMSLFDFDARIDSPSVYYGSASNNIYAFNSSDGGSTWHGTLSSTGPFITSTTVDPAAGSARAWGGSSGTCYGTVNQGTTWTSINGALSACNHVQQDQVPGVYLYADGQQGFGSSAYFGVYRSTDGGTTWNLYPTSSTQNLGGPVEAFATGRYSSTIGGSVIYANVGLGSTKFVALDPSYSSTTWRDFTSQLTTPSTPDFTRMKFSPSYVDYNVAFAFTDNKIWRTVSSGQTWSFMGATTPIPSNAMIYDVIEDPLNTSIWIAATSLGTYKTSDGGLTWRAWKNGVPQGYPTAVRLHGQVTGSPSTFQVFGGFAGRGIWQRDAAGDDS
jgi:hypothetical protein